MAEHGESYKSQTKMDQKVPRSLMLNGGATPRSTTDIHSRLLSYLDPCVLYHMSQQNATLRTLYIVLLYTRPIGGFVALLPIFLNFSGQ
jgi:hypothetical protein